MGSLLHNLPIFQIFQKLRIDRSKKWKMNEENNLFLNFFKENEEKGRFRAKRRRFIRKFRDKRNRQNQDKSAAAEKRSTGYAPRNCISLNQ